MKLRNRKKLSKEIPKRKKVELDDLLARSETEMESIARSMTPAEKQKIYKMLSMPWIEETSKIHASQPISSVIPGKRKRKDKFSGLVRKIMISSGDPCPSKDTVRYLTKEIQAFMQEKATMSKKELREENRGKTDFERMEFNEMRTRNMNVEEYKEFAEIRETNFLSLGKQKFQEWTGTTHSAKQISHIAWRKINLVVEQAIRNRHPDQKLHVIATPLTLEEIQEQF